MKKFILLMVAVAGCSASSFAQKPAVVLNNDPGWHRIGETVVNFRTESDELIVVGADRFVALRFKVTDAPVMINTLEVFYDKGDSQKITLDMTIKAAGESDVVKLDGGERKIKRISFVYKTVTNTADNKARIEVYGLKE